MPRHSSRTGTLGWTSAIILATAALGLAGDGTPDRADKGGKTFRTLVLEQFDANGDGRLDHKEQAAATRALLTKNSRDTQRQALRAQALAEFDSNANGMLERQEVRDALRTVSDGSTATRTCKRSDHSKSRTASNNQTRQAQAAVERQLMTLGGMDSATAKEIALENFDANQDGKLDQSELANAQSALQQYAQAQGVSGLSLQPSFPQITIAVNGSGLTTSTGTTSTGTTTTGTSTTSSTTTGMCSGSSGSSSGTSSSGQSSSAVRDLTGQGVANSTFGGGGGFGGGAGGVRRWSRRGRRWGRRVCGISWISRKEIKGSQSLDRAGRAEDTRHSNASPRRSAWMHLAGRQSSAGIKLLQQALYPVDRMLTNGVSPGGL